MAILTAFGSWALGVIIQSALKFITGLVAAYLALRAAIAVKQAQAKADEAQLQKAKTPEDKNAAADAINRDTFGRS